MDASDKAEPVTDTGGEVIEKSRQVGRSAFLAAAYGTGAHYHCVRGDQCFCGIGLRCSNWVREGR